MPNEDLMVDRWLVATLEGDATLMGYGLSGAFNESIPYGKSLPAIRFANQRSNDVFGIGTNRIMTTIDKLVVVVIEGLGPGNAYAPSSRMDTVLQGASGSVVDGFVLSCVRLEPIKLREFTDNKTYWHVGGIYRINAQIV